MYSSRMRLWTIFNYLLVPFLCILSSLYVLFGNSRVEYNLMFLLPIVFLFCYELLLKRNLTNSFKVFSISYTSVSAIRYVLAPVLIVLAGRYDGRSLTTPSEDSFFLAFLLMIMELLVCSLLIWVLGKKLEKNKNKKKECTFSKRWVIYVSFIIITFSMILFKPELLSSFSFIRPNVEMLNYSDFEIFDQIVILFTNVSKNLVMLFILASFYKKYCSKKSLSWVFLSFVVIMINNLFYFGTNRFDFVLNIIASTIIFCYIYKDYWKITTIIMAVLCCIGFAMISQARNSYESLGNGDASYKMADLSQIYFGGPYNVAIAIEAAKAFPEGRNISTALYDCTRSVIGLNVLVRKIDDVKLTDYYFNKRIFNNGQNTQIIPMIGEGYYLFGIILAPLLDVMFIFIAYLLTKKKDEWSLEIEFFFILSLVRLGFINCQSATIQLDDLSFNLFVPLALFFVNRFICVGSVKDISEVKK